MFTWTVALIPLNASVSIIYLAFSISMFTFVVSSQINREKALHTLFTLDDSRHAKFTILSPWCSQVLSDELSKLSLRPDRYEEPSISTILKLCSQSQFLIPVWACQPSDLRSSVSGWNWLGLPAIGSTIYGQWMKLVVSVSCALMVLCCWYFDILA